MKAQIRLKSYWIEVEGESQKGLFANIASATEIFGETKCGVCGSEDIRPVVRHVVKGKKSFDYHEYHCQNPKCRARLALGLNLEGDTLFPKRKLDKNGKPDLATGKFGEHNGWSKFKGDDAAPEGE